MTSEEKLTQPLKVLHELSHRFVEIVLESELHQKQISTYEIFCALLNESTDSFAFSLGEGEAHNFICSLDHEEGFADAESFTPLSELIERVAPENNEAYEQALQKENSTPS